VTTSLAVLNIEDEPKHSAWADTWVAEAVALPRTGDRDIAGTQHQFLTIGGKNRLAVEQVAYFDALVAVHR